MATAKKKKAKVVKSALVLMNLKISRKDRKLIIALAAKHAGGNYSAWMRHASLHFKPKKTEFIR
jgi:hypothetical protein